MRREGGREGADLPPSPSLCLSLSLSLPLPSISLSLSADPLHLSHRISFFLGGAVKINGKGPGLPGRMMAMVIGG